MIHIFILFLWNVFCWPSKRKTNTVEKQKHQEHNNDNNQRLARVFVNTTEIHATQTEPYLRWVGSCFSTHVQGNQFSARQS